MGSLTTKLLLTGSFKDIFFAVKLPNFTWTHTACILNKYILKGSLYKTISFSTIVEIKGFFLF